MVICKFNTLLVSLLWPLYCLSILVMASDYPFWYLYTFVAKFSPLCEHLNMKDNLKYILPALDKTESNHSAVILPCQFVVNK